MNSIIRKLQKYNYKFNDAIKNIKSQDYKKYSQHQIKYMTQLLKSIKSTQRGGADLSSMTDTLNKFEFAVDSAYKQQKTKASDAQTASNAADATAAKATEERDAAVGKIAAAEAEKNAANTAKDTAEREKNNAVAAKDDAVSKIAVAEAATAAANAAKDAALAKITTLEDELATATDKYNKETADLTEAQKLITSLRDMSNKLMNDIIAYKASAASATTQIAQLQAELKVAQDRAGAAAEGAHVAGEEIKEIYKNYYKLAMLYIRNFVKTAKNLNLTIDSIVNNGVVNNNELKTQFDLNDNELAYVTGTAAEVLDVEANLRGKLNPAVAPVVAPVEEVVAPAVAPAVAPVVVPAVVEEEAAPAAPAVVPQDFKKVVNSESKAKNVLQRAIENKKNVPAEYEKYLLSKIKRANAGTVTERIGSRYTELKPTRNRYATKDDMIGWANSLPYLLTVQQVNELTGGSLNDEKYREKYLKYKAKYMELKSKMH
jgi:hypothetical protein